VPVKIADRDVAALRRFNRFYTQRIGVLAEGLTGTDYSLAEARLIYELAHREGATAVTLGRDLGLDEGYLSRILARFVKAKLLERARSPSDGRERLLALTKRGRDAFARLDAAARRQARDLLGQLPSSARSELVGAMERVEFLLDGSTASARLPKKVRIQLRAPQPGDLGWVIHRHGALYAAEYGWDASFEALVAGIVAAFARQHDPQCERCWIAEAGGRIAGSVFVVRESDTEAKLRLLFVEREARGLGLGRRLVAECIAFARAAGYQTLTLWTNDILVAARGIYETEGFRLIHQAPHRSFGKDLVEQTWSLDL